MGTENLWPQPIPPFEKKNIFFGSSGVLATQDPQNHKISPTLSSTWNSLNFPLLFENMSTPYLNACLNYLSTDVDILFKDMFTLYLRICLNENRVFDVMLKYFFNMFSMTQNGSKCIQRVEKAKNAQIFSLRNFDFV